MKRVRVIIADDSRTYRSILSRVLGEIDGVEIVGEAEDGLDAVAQCAKHAPDLMLLDLEMPKLSGLPTLERMRKENPDVAVAIVSSCSQAGTAMKALGAGALEIVRKPDGGEALDSLRTSLTKIVTTVSRMGRELRVPQATPQSTRPPETRSLDVDFNNAAFDLVVIAVSTGGPAALQEVVPKLPAEFPVPILIVQHLPRGFMEELAEKLDRLSSLDVAVAKDGESLPTRGVRFAPAGTHLELRSARGSQAGYQLWEKQGPRVQGCRPAADVLLQSIARNFEGRVLCTVMTGMGCDGRDGIQALGHDHTYTIVQDQSTSTIYGMPRAVSAAGLADEEQPLDQLATRLQQLISGK